MPLRSINPATEAVIAEHQELSGDDIEQKLVRAQQGFELWRTVPFSERAEKLRKLASLLKAQSRELGELITQEMGKPVAQGQAEVEKCAWACEYYAENAEKFLAPQTVATDASNSYVRFDPIGVVLAVMPWNFPFWQVFRFIAPASMAGNVGILKHASNVQLCAQRIEALFSAAGYPVGVFQNLTIGASRVEALIRDPRIKAVTLTGSEAAGAAVASVAGQEIKKTVLELGGSDPFIIFEDADLTTACEVATMARLQSNGQSCIAAKRFLVQDSVATKFTEMFKQKFESLIVGDPMDPTTIVGPVATAQGFKDLTDQVERALASGATLITGGRRVSNTGYFYQPTILSNVTKQVSIYSEEVFGPVASVITFTTEAEAIAIANDTNFGLSASVWTSDMDRAHRVIPQIDSGAVFVNGMVKSDPRLPFGGEKRSGYGRELSEFGIREFVNTKSVWIK